ncbi:MAG: NADH-quinone oxidoreductase subunit N [Chitinophagaceae bacterium]
MLNDVLQLLKSELILAVILFILLFIKLSSRQSNNEVLLNIINALLLLNLVLGFFMNEEGALFNQMFRTNPLIQVEKSILNLGTLVISMQAYGWLKNHEHLLEFYILMLASLLGMFFMISGGNLMMFYVGLELATIPLAAIANFDLERRQSSEAAMKLIMSSAFSSGLLLFGISLVYGSTGSLDYTVISQNVNANPLQLFAFILLLGGFAFKTSVVPFHLWTADVYEGAPVPVTSFLSVISKGAFFFAFLSVLYKVFPPLADNWYRILLILSVLTMLVGNLFALRQHNLKRLLAFSSIAQAGFILIGILGSSQQGMASVVYFVLIYVFSNLGAFGVVAAVSALTGKETVDDYKGLHATNPFLAWIMAVALFSLAGIPPTAGFFGKFFLLMAGAGKGNFVLIAIAAINMVIALYYYLVIVKTMFMDTSASPIEKLAIPFYPKVAMLICVVGILVTGFIPWIYDYIWGMANFAISDK